jgi:hypothetical protein
MAKSTADFGLIQQHSATHCNRKESPVRKENKERYEGKSTKKTISCSLKPQLFVQK